MGPPLGMLSEGKRMWRKPKRLDTVGFRVVVQNRGKRRGCFANHSVREIVLGAMLCLALFASPRLLGAGAGQFSVSVQIQGSGSVSIDPPGNLHNAGSILTLTALPGRWYSFSGWSDGSFSNPRTLLLSEDSVLTAEFNQTVPLEMTKYKTRQWDRSYGGKEDDRLLFLLPTADDGWILAGDSSSPGSDGKTTAGCGGSDFWVLKMDRDGERVWEQSLGGPGRERLAFVQAVAGGDLLLGGFSDSEAECTKESGSFGRGDFWIVRLNSAGSKVWEQVLGGSGSEQFPVCRPTSDGGAILGGYSDSGAGGNKTTVGFGGFDYWLVKLGSGGEKEWDRTFGGSGDDFLSCLVVTADGGFVVAGSSASPPDGNKTSPRLGAFDYWVLKLDSAGEREWDRSYGGTGDDILSFGEARDDGGVVLAGYSSPDSGGNKTIEGFGDYDYWVLRIDSTGNKQWDATFGGTQADVLSVLQPTDGNGFLLGGQSESGVGGNKTTAGNGGTDYWIVKIDENGIKEWEQTFGGSGGEVLFSARQTLDGGFVLGGYSESPRGANKLLANLGGADFWIVKTDHTGNREWEQTLGGRGEDVVYSVQETRDGNLVCGGYSQSGIDGNKEAVQYGGQDYWVVKLVSLELPVGTPLILVNDEWVPSGSVTIGDLADIKIQSSFPNGSIFYTLDGSAPDSNSIPYSGPFSATRHVTVRAVSFNEDRTVFVPADPVDVSVLPTYRLTVSSEGGGAIELDPPYGPYLSNSVVTVTAVPESGWALLRWTGEARPPEESIQVTMNGDQAFEAIFGTSVFGSAEANGSVLVDPDVPLHAYGSLVRLTALPDPGYYFSVWDGDNDLSGSANPIEFPVTVGPFGVTALFLRLGPNQVTVVTPIVGSGTVSVNPQKDVYTVGETVTLTASATSGQIFVGWDQDGEGYTNPLTVVLSRSKTMRARFATPGIHVDRSSVAADGLHLKLVGQVGARSQIDWSSDLINWTPLSTNTNSTPLIEILDPAPVAEERRFYRFKPVP